MGGDLSIAESLALPSLGPGRPIDPSKPVPPPTASDTLRKVEPFFARFGITRVGDLTDLDVIGIPVWFACRPNSRALSVSQGKGLDRDQARVSAVMESLESAIAERPKRFVTEFGSIKEVGRRGLRIIPLQSMMRCIPEAVDPHRERAWVPGISLRTGDRFYAPYELIGLDIRARSPWDHGAFRVTSIGLACGNTMAEATLHGLYEIIENDGTSFVEMWPARAHRAKVINYERGCHNKLDQAVGKVRDAGIEPVFRDLSTDIALPIVMSVIEFPVSSAANGGTRYAAGFACRAEPEEAALCALLEAVQTRLTEISGARDDIAYGDYKSHRAHLDTPSPTAKRMTFAEMHRDHVPPAAETEGRLRYVLDALIQAGIADIFLFPLGGSEMGIQAVRVLATDLEAGFEDGTVRCGRRGISRLLGTH